MPTYNRLRMLDGKVDALLVEEAIMSFLMQDYPVELRQLLIINDTPGQTLRIYEDFRSVTVINSAKRFETLGDKCNYGIDLVAEHEGFDYITRWDDDDISLPTRLSGCAERAAGMDVLVVEGYYFDNGGPCGDWSALSGAYGFQQDWYALGLARSARYQKISNGEDQAFRRDCLRLADKDRVSVYRPSVEHLHYVYRWGSTGQLHVSSGSTDPEFMYRRIGQQPILELDYCLKPHWRFDYVTLARKVSYEHVRCRAGGS